MIQMLINLLLINAIVSLVYLSGFWDNLDEWVSRKWKFRHLPHLLTCALCQCWWLGLLYVIVSGNLSILTIALCLVNAHLTKVVTPLWSVIENWLLKIIELIMPK